MEVPEQFENLEEIRANEIRRMAQDGCLCFEQKAVRGEALDALHEAFFQGIPVLLNDCRIEGSLDFTKGPLVALAEAEELSEETKEKLKNQGTEKVVLVKGPIKMDKFLIRGGVVRGWDSRWVSDVGLGTKTVSVVFSEASFCHTRFHSKLDLQGATFCGGVNFSGATFDREAFFRHVTFGGGVNFSGAVFGKGAFFGQATFGRGARFEGATFCGGASFLLATFGEGVSFGRATFGRGANFQQATFEGAAAFLGRRAREDKVGAVAEKSKLVFNRRADFTAVDFKAPEKVTFQQVNLRRASFLDTPLDKVQFIDVDWAEREGRKCIFDEVAERPREKDYALIARLYRQLKKNYEEQRAFVEAGDFHMGEMEMTLAQHRANWEKKKDRKEWFFWLLTKAYKVLSGYGERLDWALWVLLWLWVVPAAIYAKAHLLSASGPDHGILKSLFLGLMDSIKVMTLRWWGLRPAALPASGLVVMIFQGILGPIQLALVALALRRQFRR